MRPSEFDFLVGMLKEQSGIIITQDKMYLIESRLGPLLVEHRCRDLDDLVSKLRAAPRGPLAAKVVEAMTTNETFFFRDKTPFDELEQKVLPSLVKARAGKRIRIWCAAASSGQEPYSIAMILKESAPKLNGCTFEIIGTDISPQILEKAKAGLYTQFEVQRGLPIKLLVKYFQQKGETWQIDPAIKSMVQLRQYNLLDSYATLGSFDIIFCRNVLIYFDRPTKRSMLDRMASILADDGALFMGAAETVIGITETLVPFEGARGLYRTAKGGASGTRAVPAAVGAMRSA